MLLGPFGTGKTAVMAEIAKQLVRLIPQSRVLICAPSNSAADIFASKLASFEEFVTPPGSIIGGVKTNGKAAPQQSGTQKMLRLYASSRPREAVPHEILPFTFWNESLGSFDTPSLEQLKQYRIIVTTCNSASILYNAGVPQGFFTHIAIDEAAQLMEPEVLIPLSLAAYNKTSVILAGDHKQLGPRLQSGFVRQHELSSSIMERLSSIPIYSEQQRSDMLLRLNKNYRSHAAILEFPSKRFYNGALQAKLERAKAERCADWARLKNRSSPVLFCGVEGEDMREADSPSFFNPHEVVQIGKLIQDLLHDPHIIPSLKPSEIGVVTPFYKQSQKIRQYLRQRDMGEVFVGSVDECQGKEFAALFISTVRASRRWHENYDQIFSVGFLNDEKMMNTAMTRAVGLLVCVGDPYVLDLDDNWREFMSYCSAKGNYMGPELTPGYLQDREQREAKIKVPEYKPVPEAAGTEYYSAESELSSPQDQSSSESAAYDAAFPTITEMPVAETAPASTGSSKKKKKKKNKGNSNNSATAAAQPTTPTVDVTSAPPSSVSTLASTPTESEYFVSEHESGENYDDMDGAIEEAFADDVLENPHHDPTPYYEYAQPNHMGTQQQNALLATLLQQQQQNGSQNTLGFLSQYLRLAQLQQQMQQPTAGSLAANGAPQGWVAVYRWRNTFELVLIPEGAQPPPFNIYDRGTMVEIEIGKFNHVTVAQKNGDVIYIQLSPAEPGPNALVFYQPSTYSLMIRVPINEFDSASAMVVENQSHVVVHLARSTNAQWQPLAVGLMPDRDSRLV